METVKGTFPIGMKLGETVHADFEVREALVEDMVEAEKDVPPTDLHAFNVQMLCRVVTRVGSFSGPFTPVMFRRLKRPDYHALVQAMMKADDLGKPVPLGEASI
jgi:phage FluMu protein gp41